jgi:outer membrane lipoprotein-sorting protein
MAKVDDDERRRFRRRGLWLFGLGLVIGIVVGVVVVFRFYGRPIASRPGPSTQDPGVINGRLADAKALGTREGRVRESSLTEVLEMAESSLQNLRANVDDYSATLIKQERVGGVLGEANELTVKVQCRHRGGNSDDSEPMRVYLRFERPESVAGREVIWAEDLHDGKLLAHEAGLLGLMTVRLDPTGMIAMRGQKYPIFDIGLTNLLKKLIERGEKDRGSSDVAVTITSDVELNGVLCDLIEVKRLRPTGGAEDFSLAEICFDRGLNLPLRYTAYGWPDGDSEVSQAPLLESYTYLNIQTNVGLNESDFDPDNPDYQFR